MSIKNLLGVESGTWSSGNPGALSSELGEVTQARGTILESQVRRRWREVRYPVARAPRPGVGSQECPRDEGLESKIPRYS